MLLIRHKKYLIQHDAKSVKIFAAKPTVKRDDIIKHKPGWNLVK